MPKEWVVIYDMRAPSFGAPVRDLYAAALDQVAGADELGSCLTPLVAGVDPPRSWEMLRLYEREVHPYLPRGPVPTWGVQPAAAASSEQTS